MLLILIGTAGCDQATKHFARTELSQTGSITLPGSFVELTLAENPGAFLSLGASLPRATRNAVFILGATIGLSFLLAYLARTPGMSWSPFLGLAMVGAGGISNLIDRFAQHGLVTDFMVIHAGPLHTGVFNVADVIVVVGLAIFATSFRASAHYGISPARKRNGR